MPAMPSLLDIAERSQKGPRREERDWDMGLFRKMAELAKKYEIACPDDPPWFNLDDSVAERAFRAAVDFLSGEGVYCTTTGRVIQFTEQEVMQALREQPSRILVGEGRDRRVLEKRQLEYQGDFNLFPGHNAPFTEDYAPLVVKNWAQIPEASHIGGFNFPVVDGRDIFGMPMEAYAAKRQIAWMREGVRKAGRPGMAIVYYPVNTRAAVLTAPIDPDHGLRRTDGVLLSVLPDLKVEQDLITAAIVYRDYGSFSVNHCIGRYGSFVGGYEGAILEGIITHIAGWMVYRDEMGQTAVGSFVDTGPKNVKAERKGNWATSVVCQTLNRFTNYIYFGGMNYLRTAPPGTEACLWLCAKEAIQAPINGANQAMYRQLRAKMNSSQTPLEVEFKVEVARAVMRAGLNRTTAAELIERIASVPPADEPSEARRIDELYDLVNHRPSPEYQQICLRVKDRLSRMGLPIN